MKLNGKTIYAQSSDIKSRTYLEYRKDMKKKAIAELEVLEWLGNKIKELYPKKQVKVYKSGGDKFLWFLRKGGVTREPDFIADINDENIVDNLNKIPQNANLWLIYLLSYINKDVLLEDISKILYCIDFLYSKIELKQNELTLLIGKIKELKEKIDGFYQNDGSYKSSLMSSPLEETRYALFSINLLEDLIQDMIYYYSITELEPIKKIYENVRDTEKTYKLIMEAK